MVRIQAHTVLEQPGSLMLNNARVIQKIIEEGGDSVAPLFGEALKTARELDALEQASVDSAREREGEE